MLVNRLRAVVLATLTVAAAHPAWAADGFVVIVNPSVAGTQVHRRDLAALFLKKSLRWGDRSSAQPVDQSGASPVRQAFSEAVLEMPVGTVLQYWQKQMFGLTPAHPPAVKPSDAEVIAFVGRNAGAVGYVSSAVHLPAGVKAISVVD
jgi:ABC-type phosphate transport system substrate-binding protein